MSIPLHDPKLWPVRLTRAEIAAVLRISQRELRRRIAQGRFPQSDDGRTWHRDVVQRYAEGGIKQFERQAEKRERRGALHMVGGR
jgi:hypothetical protein